MVTEDTKFQVLNDHYKDSFTHLKTYIQRRDRLFLWILIVITIMLFQIASPKESGEAISQFVVKLLELNEPIDISFIGSIIWFSLLSLVVRYFQMVVLIERQYKYIHMLEEQISSNYDKGVFTREGKSYLSDYPLFSKWASALYKNLFPILLLLVVFIKITNELSPPRDASLTLIINIAIFLGVLISTFSYLLMIHFGK